jgi:hypothetical protein
MPVPAPVARNEEQIIRRAVPRPHSPYECPPPWPGNQQNGLLQRLSPLSTKQPALRIRESREENGQLLSTVCRVFLFSRFFLPASWASIPPRKPVVRSISLFLPPLLLSPPQGRTQPNDWPSNISCHILAAVTQPSAPGVMPPGPPFYPQSPGCVTNVSGTHTSLDPQYDPALMRDQRPLRNALSLLCQASPYRLVNAYHLVSPAYT